MEKADRKTRIAVVASVLIKNPGRSYSLKVFCDMFGAAKSTMSEDIAILRNMLKTYGQGDIEVTLGAGGGVKYVPLLLPEDKTGMLFDVARRLSDPSRILPGGYIYTVDIFSNPAYVCAMADILAGMFNKTNPDFVATVETKGVALAFSVARALSKPLVIARRDAKITEGSVVTINYLAGSSSRMRTMSISKRAVSPGQKALLIDDFIAGGGTVHALCEMMKEFSITVVGSGVAIATALPEKKRVDNYKALLRLEEVDMAGERIVIHPV
ncbi:MAG: pur operon repressor [Eubacteriales bacterium]|nr:pur operon repressor [Eubacteriales bacterium]